LETRLGDSEGKARRKKPPVDADQPVDIGDNNAVVDRMKLLLEVVRLAFETDSTRYVTLHLTGNAGAIPIDGVNAGYHSLSQHSRDEDKLDQPTLVESTWSNLGAASSGK
jgi:hypothetical protein